MTSLTLRSPAKSIYSMIPPLVDPERKEASEALDQDDEFLVDQSSFKAASNVYESEVSYVLEVMAPGFQKSEIFVDMDRPGILTVSAVRENEPDCFFARREFISENFSRSFRLPDDILLKEMCAAYENGLITVIMPKKAALRDLMTIILE